MHATVSGAPGVQYLHEEMTMRWMALARPTDPSPPPSTTPQSTPTPAPAAKLPFRCRECRLTFRRRGVVAAPRHPCRSSQMWSIPVDRITLDGVEQVRDKLAAWQAGSTERRAYLALVTFDNLKDPAERHYFREIKTRLQLPKEQVDKVREVAGRLLREAPAFQWLLADLKAGR